MNKKRSYISPIAISILWANMTFAGVTGKIAGKVTDAETGGHLVGTNIILEGTMLGAASDIDGNYVILNIPPGSYTIKAMMIGYAAVSYSDIRVNVDLTTTVDFTMKVESIKGEEVVVVSERRVVKADVASSQINISSDRIEDLPVVSVAEVIGFQAGVEGMSVRQGGENELSMMLDGISLKDDRTGEPIIGIPLSSVQEIMIQSGGFNAEYSDLQAGIINVVTKKGAADKYTLNLNLKYSPPAPKHFGISPYDPDSYYLRPFLDDDVSWEGTDNGAWDKYTQNQYPSFKGWNKVSQGLLSDDDPTNDLSPKGAQRLFLWQHRRKGNIVKPDYNVDIGFGGPVPVVSQDLGNLRFFTSYRGEENMYLVPFSRDGYHDWAWSTKLTSDVTPQIQLTLSTFFKETKASNADEVGGPTYFKTLWDVADAFGAMTQENSKVFYPEYWCRMDISNRMFSARLTNMLSQKSFYEGIIEYASTEYFTGPGPVRDDSTLIDIFPGDMVFNTDESPFGFSTSLASESIDGFMMGAKSNARDSTVSSRLKVRFDYTTQANQHNQIKTGFQFESFNYEMNYGAINPDLPAGRPWTKWNRNPFQIDVYMQDKLEFKGWIATLGLRGEYFDPNGKWYDVEEFDPSFFSSKYRPADEENIPTRRSKGTFTLMPRLGISHPITENSKFYFNYGHMRQKFNPDYLFSVRRATSYQVQRYGNPELPMEKTVAYELGYDHSLLGQYLFHIAGYYKDKTDQMGTLYYESKDFTVTYSKYSNIFYQDVRGLEVELRKRRGDWLTGFVNYTYSVYSSGRFGVREQYESKSEQRKYEEKVSTQVQYRPLPRPKVNFNLSLHVPQRWGPSLIANRILGGWLSSFTGYWRAGGYATYGNVAGVVNNVRWKDTYNVDLRLMKSIRLNNVNITFLLEAFNVFNFKHLSDTGFGDRVMTVGDRLDYEESLQFPASVYEELGEKHLSGHDRLGDYRKPGVEFQAMDYVGRLDENFIGDPTVIYFVEDKVSSDGSINTINTYLQVDNSGDWVEVSKSRIDKILKDKAYIDNPNNESFMFLRPRDIYWGIKISYDL